MSRKERRQYNKDLKKRLRKDGYSKQQAAEFANLMTSQFNSEKLDAGEKVKIDYDRFLRNEAKSPQLTKFVEFVEENKDKVFTVMYEPMYEEKKMICCLEEDTSDPRWTFSPYELIRVNNNPYNFSGIEFVEGEKK